MQNLSVRIETGGVGAEGAAPWVPLIVERNPEEAGAGAPDALAPHDAQKCAKSSLELPQFRQKPTSATSALTCFTITLASKILLFLSA